MVSYDYSAKLPSEQEALDGEALLLPTMSSPLKKMLHKCKNWWLTCKWLSWAERLIFKKIFRCSKQLAGFAENKRFELLEICLFLFFFVFFVPYSDHYLVGLFVPKPSDLGPRLWRFPGDLLDDENFCIQIELILLNFDNKCSHASWEEIKAKVQTLSWKNTCFCQQQAKLEISALKNSLKAINKKIFEGEKLDSDRISLEKQIEQINDHAWFFNKNFEHDWIEIEGTMTPDFLYLEDIKTNFSLDLLLIHGEETSDLDIVLSEMHKFYSGLYSAEHLASDEEMDAFLLSLLNLPTTVGDTSSMCQEIMEKEIEMAIIDLKSGKVPGSDGLIANFYKWFSDLLTPILYKVFNDAFQHKILTTSQYLAIIILLFKRGH